MEKPVDEVITDLEKGKKVPGEVSRESEKTYRELINEFNEQVNIASERAVLTGADPVKTFRESFFNKVKSPSIGYEVEFVLKPIKEKFLDNSKPRPEAVEFISNGYQKALERARRRVEEKPSSSMNVMLFKKYFNMIKETDLFEKGIYLGLGKGGVGKAKDQYQKTDGPLQGVVNHATHLLAFVTTINYSGKYIGGSSLEKDVNEIQTKKDYFDLKNWKKSTVLIGALKELKEVFKDCFGKEFFDYFILQIASIHIHLNIEFIRKEGSEESIDAKILKSFFWSQHYLPLTLIATYKIKRGEYLSIRLKTVSKRKAFDLKGINISNITQLEIKLPEEKEKISEVRSAYEEIYPQSDYEMHHDPLNNILFIKTKKQRIMQTLENKMPDGTFRGEIPILHPIISLTLYLRSLKTYEDVFKYKSNEAVRMLEKHSKSEAYVKTRASLILNGVTRLNDHEKDSLITFVQDIKSGARYGGKQGFLNYKGVKHLVKEGFFKEFINEAGDYLTYKLLLLGEVYLKKKPSYFNEYVKFLFKNFKEQIKNLIEKIKHKENELRDWFKEPERLLRRYERKIYDIKSDVENIRSLGWIDDFDEKMIDKEDESFKKAYLRFITWLIVYFEHAYRDLYLG